MQKQCTNSACRRSFSTDGFTGSCPWCGRKYPRLSAVRSKPVQKLLLNSCGESKFCAVRAVCKLTGLSPVRAKKMIDRLPKHSPVRIVIKRPENLAAAELLLQNGKAKYRFVSSRKRRKRTHQQKPTIS